VALGAPAPISVCSPATRPVVGAAIPVLVIPDEPDECEIVAVDDVIWDVVKVVLEEVDEPVEVLLVVVVELVVVVDFVVVLVVLVTVVLDGVEVVL